jgi:hypothetical protein
LGCKRRAAAYLSSFKTALAPFCFPGRRRRQFPKAFKRLECMTGVGAALIRVIFV